MTLVRLYFTLLDFSFLLSVIGESCHATTNRHKYKPYCMCILSCIYYTIHYVIHLISGSSVHAGALSLTGYEPSWSLSAAFGVYLCFLCVILSHLSHLGSFQCYLHLSAFQVGNNYLPPFKLLSVGTICAFEVICIEMCLCIVSCTCGACWASAPCSALIWAWCVEIYLHILGSPLFCWW